MDVTEKSTHRRIDHGEDEEQRSNPLQHKLIMSSKDWILTYMCAILILPIRILLLLVIHLVGYLVARIGLFNLSKMDLANKPLCSNWRKVMKNILGFLCRGLFRVCGVSVTIKGNIASVEEAPLLVMAPHTSYFDAVLMWWSNTPSCVIAEDKIKIPIYGKTWTLFQYLTVQRRDANSRENTEKEILRRTNVHKHPNEDERWPQIALFPEGVITNGKQLMRFKNGAFKPGKPVQPVLIRYPNEIDTVTLDRRNPMQGVWVTLCQPLTRVELEYLPVCYPSVDEKSDPELFSTNVNKLMATKLLLPRSEMTYKEAEQQQKKWK